MNRSSLYLFVLLITIVPTNGLLNIFLNRIETRRLLGLSADVFYIKEGKLNDYALGFQVPVPANISDLYYTWSTVNNTKISYSISLSVDHINALEQPTINISREGEVPNKEQVFRILLPCKPNVNAEVDVNIYFNLTSPTNTLSLTLKRKKICLKDVDDSPPLPIPPLSVEGSSSASDPSHAVTDTPPSDPLGGNRNNDHHLHHPDLKESGHHKDSELRGDDGGNKLKDSSPPSVAPPSPFYLVVVGASGFIFLLGIISMMCYVKSTKDRIETIERSSVYGVHSGHLNKTGSDVESGTLRTSIHSRKSGSCRSLSRLGDTLVPPTYPYNSLRRIGSPQYSSLPRSTVHIYCEPHATRLSDQVEQLAIERRKFLLNDKLYGGTFGSMHQGILIKETRHEIKILIKSVTESVSKHQVNLFLQEGMMLFGLDHGHIFAPIAACVDDPHRPILMYPLCLPGNLKLFLQQSKCTPYSTTSTQDLVLMAIHIVRGMSYLHSHHRLHRDLGARNCYLQQIDGTSSFTVKIGDSSLARDFFPGDYHCLGDNENRPIKWLALESLCNKEFTQFSDVWSFGVTLWELMTLGQQPYFEVDPYEMAAYLKDGYRLFQPINCPDKLYDVMVCCWTLCPENRPSFKELHTYLSEFHSDLTVYV